MDCCLLIIRKDPRGQSSTSTCQEGYHQNHIQTQTTQKSATCHANNHSSFLSVKENFEIKRIKYQRLGCYRTKPETSKKNGSLSDELYIERESKQPFGASFSGQEDHFEGHGQWCQENQDRQALWIWRWHELEGWQGCIWKEANWKGSVPIC